MRDCVEYQDGSCFPSGLPSMVAFDPQAPNDCDESVITCQVSDDQKLKVVKSQIIEDKRERTVLSTLAEDSNIKKTLKVGPTDADVGFANDSDWRANDDNWLTNDNNGLTNDNNGLTNDNDNRLTNDDNELPNDNNGLTIADNGLTIDNNGLTNDENDKSNENDTDNREHQTWEDFSNNFWANKNLKAETQMKEIKDANGDGALQKEMANSNVKSSIQKERRSSVRSSSKQQQIRTDKRQSLYPQEQRKPRFERRGSCSNIGQQSRSKFERRGSCSNIGQQSRSNKVDVACRRSSCTHVNQNLANSQKKNHDNREKRRQHRRRGSCGNEIFDSRDIHKNGHMQRRGSCSNINMERHRNSSNVVTEEREKQLKGNKHRSIESKEDEAKKSSIHARNRRKSSKKKVDECNEFEEDYKKFTKIRNGLQRSNGSRDICTTDDWLTSAKSNFESGKKHSMIDLLDTPDDSGNKDSKMRILASHLCKRKSSRRRDLTETPSSTRGSLSAHMTPSTRRGSLSAHMTSSTRRGSLSAHVTPSTRRGSLSEHVMPSTRRGSLSEHGTPSSTRGSLSEHVSRSRRRGSLSEHVTPSTRRGSLSEPASRSSRRGSLSAHLDKGDEKDTCRIDKECSAGLRLKKSVSEHNAKHVVFKDEDESTLSTLSPDSSTSSSSAGEKSKTSSRSSICKLKMSPRDTQSKKASDQIKSELQKANFALLTDEIEGNGDAFMERQLIGKAKGKDVPWINRRRHSMIN